VNHLVVNQVETKYVIAKLRKFIKARPMQGFWVISFAAFIISPFLTNDGVCLLFVEPLLSVFVSGTGDASSPTSPKEPRQLQNGSATALAAAAPIPDKAQLAPRDGSELCSKDAIFFLLTLACSANIGSALTYTGNPQNMIVSGDCIKLLPPGMFLLYQLLPSVVAWVITTCYVYHCWSENVRQRLEVSQRWLTEEELEASAKRAVTPPPGVLKGAGALTGSVTAYLASLLVGGSTADEKSEQVQLVSAVDNGAAADKSAELESGLPAAASPRRRAALAGTTVPMGKKGNGHIVVSPAPYLILFLLLVMITMIFVDVMSIACLICVTAMVMIVSLIMGNHWRTQLTMIPSAPDSDSEDDDLSIVDPESPNDAESHEVRQGEDQDRRPASPACAQHLTREQRTDNLTHFFDEMFNSVDYSLLLIFLGTFIVVANVESTGLPRKLWSQIVGNVPFRSAGSVIGISLFVLVASQFLGNVAIIQMAKPNISSLDDEDKKYAWVLISFVATVGGNLTITGSAANIIVAEKARRIDPNAPIEFFNHFRVCFLVTVASCFIGGAIITLLMGQTV
jgi:Na+/H+ antiporter NhaD/arsenite permease-like protein